jgi:hypothetical protein
MSLYDAFRLAWQLPWVATTLPHAKAATSNTDSNLNEGAL